MKVNAKMYTETLREYGRLILLGALALIPMQFKAYANPSPELSDLIGNIGITNDFQNGWKKTDTHLFSTKESLEVITIFNGKIRALALAEVHTARQGIPRTSRILKAIKLTSGPTKKYRQIWNVCKTPKPLPADQEILSEITLKRCQRYSTYIHKAWLVNLTDKTIDSYPTNGIRCEDAGYNSGEGGPCPIITSK